MTLNRKWFIFCTRWGFLYTLCNYLYWSNYCCISLMCEGIQFVL